MGPSATRRASDGPVQVSLRTGQKAADDEAFTLVSRGFEYDQRAQSLAPVD
jgi:hypothetical protein